MKTRVRGKHLRNERGRLRIGRIDVERLARCLGMSEDFCVVTASIRKGIDVGVVVMDSPANRLFEGTEETAG